LDQESGITVDEFQALEQRVQRAVEIVRREREARAAAESDAAALREQIAALNEQVDALTSSTNSAQGQITTLNQEREAVRLRVEKMMQQIDELL
jgi:peptidoglycan hydrolase CwlO-like protein